MEWRFVSLGFSSKEAQKCTWNLHLYLSIKFFSRSKTLPPCFSEEKASVSWRCIAQCFSPSWAIPLQAFCPAWLALTRPAVYRGRYHINPRAIFLFILVKLQFCMSCFQLFSPDFFLRKPASCFMMAAHHVFDVTKTAPVISLTTKQCCFHFFYNQSSLLAVPPLLSPTPRPSGISTSQRHSGCLPDHCHRKALFLLISELPPPNLWMFGFFGENVWIQLSSQKHK